MPLCSNFYFIVCSLAQLLKCLQPLSLSHLFLPSTSRKVQPYPNPLSSQGYHIMPSTQHTSNALCPGSSMVSAGRLSWYPCLYESLLPSSLSSSLLLFWCKELCLQPQCFIFHINNDLISFLAAFISKTSMGFLSWNPISLFHILYSFPWMLLPPLFEFLKDSQKLTSGYSSISIHFR